jgi:nitrite reductase/ring-hydroxylating ferredoxin subunit
MNRNKFLRTGSALVVCSCCGSTVLNGCKAISGNSDTIFAPEQSFSVKGNILRLKLDKIPALKEAGSSVQLDVADNGKNLIIIHESDNEYKAFEDKCTHGGRELEYKTDEKVLRCVSFGHSEFDIEGRVTKGPAEADILTFPTTLDNNELFIDIA